VNPEAVLERPANASQLEIELLLLGLEQAYAADFRQCSRRLVAETVDEMLVARRLPSPAALLHESLQDPNLGRQAVAMLEASRLELFRDHAFFQLLKQRIVPWLRTYPYINVWAVQCGDASDLYSVAILLEEAGLLARSQIYATEADAERLAGARASPLAAASVRLAERNYRAIGGTRPFDTYLERADGSVAIARRLKRQIVWAQFSPDSGYSFNEFELILCRNPSSWLTQGALHTALGVITESLSLSGLLVFDAGDAQIAGVAYERLRTWGDTAHVYQRAF
jgi:chemotaxis protein methyltransferase CheR